MNTFIITFRESLEASLIIGIIYTILYRKQLSSHIKFLWFGLLAAIVSSVVFAFLLEWVNNSIQNESIEKLTEGRTYQDEIDFLVTYEKRNKFIANLAVNQTGNTLVLFNLVDRHGKGLRDLIESRLQDGQRLFFVSGETKTTDREQIRNIVDKQKNSIILASLGTFSTGINIKNLHNVVFASPSKSQIRVLQSIGRGLRLSDDGSVTKLYDIADDLHWKSKKNFTLLHSGERIKIYTKEKFPYKITQVEI